MKQTEKVSIGGYSFILERDAYERLNGYKSQNSSLKKEEKPV